MAVVTVAIDNLGKGGAGQAVHAINVRFGFDETAGLESRVAVAVSAPVRPIDAAPGSARRSASAAGSRRPGIRGDGDETRTDVAVIRSDTPAAAAGVFTRNTVKAAPVVISQLTPRRGTPISAIVVNAGNANACTGAQGFRDALVMCTTAGDALDLDPSDVLVCSTGRDRPADAHGPRGARHPRGRARHVTVGGR